MGKSRSVSATLDKWKRNTSAAGPSYTAGVMAVTEAPGAKAAAAVDKYEAGVRKAIDEGTFAENSRKVSLQSWQQSASEGASRLASGVKKGEGKMQKFLGEFLPFAQQVSDQIQSMPSTTESDRDQRMLENARKLRGFKFKK